MSAAPSILVRGPNWLGDLVMSTPGFRALRAGFPSAHLALQVRPGLEPIVSGAPWFDEVLPLRSYHRGPLAMLREARTLRARGFSHGVCIPDSWSSALLLRAAGVRDCVGYAGGGRELLLARAVPRGPGGGRHKLVSRERFVLGLVAAMGCDPRGTELELFTTPDEERRAERVLRDRGIEIDAGGESWVGLAPGASYGPSKEWPVASFSAVGDAAVAAGARVLILGTAAEAGLVAGVARAMSHPAVSLAGALDLGGLKVVVRKLRALVCNDAGSRHVAAAFGVPCLVLMGPTSLEKTSDNLEGVRVFETDVSCRPCYQRVCPIDHRCMTRLEPAPVAEALHTILVSAAAAGGRRGAPNAGP